MFEISKNAIRHQMLVCLLVLIVLVLSFAQASANSEGWGGWAYDGWTLQFRQRLTAWSPLYMSLQVPTIGRIVHYRDAAGVVCPAIVHTVHSDACVSLHVFRPFQPSLEIASSVNFENVPDADTPHNNRWFWPPHV